MKHHLIQTLLILTACGCGAMSVDDARAAAPTTAPAVREERVSIDNFSFSPQTITVAAGTRVTWTNRDDVPHTVTANDNRFASQSLDTDDRYTRLFTEPGVYPYFCAVHPHMTGTIIVK